MNKTINPILITHQGEGFWANFILTALLTEDLTNLLVTPIT